MLLYTLTPLQELFRIPNVSLDEADDVELECSQNVKQYGLLIIRQSMDVPAANADGGVE